MCGRRPWMLKSIDLLSAAIEAGWDRQIAWLQRLVRFPSLRGNEQECQNWLAEEFAQRGWQVDRYSLADVDLTRIGGAAPTIGIDPARSLQVVATIPHGNAGARSNGRSLILQGHVDVVPTGPESMWSDPPFSGVVRDGWLLGRGAQDMKAGISALVFALDAMKAAGLALSAPIYLQAVTEEESTGNGALSTLARGYTADACLIPEPSANTITRAQTGAIWFRLKIRSKPIHVESMRSATNAVFSAIALVEGLQALTQEFNAAARTHPLFKDVANPVKFNPGMIRGGDWPSSTPSWCDIDCRMGVLPGTEVEQVRRSIVETVATVARTDPLLAEHPPEIEWTGFLADAAVLEPGSQAEAMLAEAHRAVFGTGMTARLSTAVNDTRYYARQGGMPALCYGPAGEGLHGVDERVNLANLKQTTLVIAAFIATWCGAAPRSPAR